MVVTPAASVPLAGLPPRPRSPTASAATMASIATTTAAPAHQGRRWTGDAWRVVLTAGTVAGCAGRPAVGGDRQPDRYARIRERPRCPAHRLRQWRHLRRRSDRRLLACRPHPAGGDRHPWSAAG